MLPSFYLIPAHAPPTPPMEFNSTSQNYHKAPPVPIGLTNSSINLKLEILDDDFCIYNLPSSKSFLQDVHNLDQFPMTALSFNPDVGMQAIGFDRFDPFCHGSCTDFSLYKFKPCEENGSTGVAMQDFQGGGFLNFPHRKDSLMEIETALNYHDPEPVSFTAPDEGSCVTADNIGCHKSDGKKRSRKSIWSNNSNENEIASTKNCGGRGRKKTKSAKGQWTIEEDRLLIHLVEKYGVGKWSNISQMLDGRIGKQCRERWHNHLRPDIKKDVWTEEEDRILIEVHAEVGNKWSEIAKSLPRRTENSIKNHWNATKRRQFSRRKCRTKCPRPSSLLQNYIKSLNFEEGSSNSNRSNTIQPPPTNAPGILHNTSICFCQDDHKVLDYDFDEVLEFTFDDDHLLKGSSMASFMDGIPVDPLLEIDDKPCFDLELSSFIPPPMQCEVKKELDFFCGNV